MSTRDLLLGPLEFLIWRPAIRLGQLLGVWMFLAGRWRGPHPLTDQEGAAAGVRLS